jgi:hypothetical protein
MKHNYKMVDDISTDQCWSIVFTISPRYPATQTDPAGGGEIEIEEVWLVAIGDDKSERLVLDIQPHLRGSYDFEAIFGKYIYETLAEHAADEIADERAAAAEYAAEARRDGGV